MFSCDRDVHTRKAESMMPELKKEKELKGFLLSWNSVCAVWGKPAGAAGPAHAVGGVQGGASGGGGAAMPTAAVLRQRQSCVGDEMGRDEVPGRTGTDGVSVSPALRGQGAVGGS